MITQDRLGTGLSRVVLALLFIGPLCHVHDALRSLPRAAQVLGVAAIAVYLLIKMIRFPRWNDELQHFGKFLRALAFLLTVIVVENFLTWATSASDLHKYDYTPLQDNVEIAALWAFDRSPALRWAVLGWRVDMHWLLYCFLALCLSVIWDQVPYSGFFMGARFMDAIAWAHALRTVAFCITVLPNPRPGCYARSFVPVPPTVAEFVAYGLSAKRGSGCNDLVISGHGVVYAAVPLALHSFYPLPWRRGGPAALAWLAVAKLCVQEVVDKTHYSVDMLLAVAVAALVWAWRERAFPASATWRVRKPGALPDPLARSLVAAVVGIFALVLVGVAGV